MEYQLERFLGVPLNVMAAIYTLNLAAHSASKMVDDQWILKAHRLSRVIGLDALIAFLGCVGLFMAFLYSACGLKVGFHMSPTHTAGMFHLITLYETMITGVSVFAACAVIGTCTFFFFNMMITLELKGFVLMSFISAAFMLMECNRRRRSNHVSPARMLILYSVTFATLQFNVQCGINLNNASTIFILPSLMLLGFLVDRICFKKARGSIILSVILVVLFTGLALGFNIDEYYIRHPLLSQTAVTLNSVVYKMVLLSGLVGAMAGAMVAYVWIEQEAKGVSLWICGPAALILYNLDIDSKHLSLHNLLSHLFGPGGELGLIAGFAAASGLACGLAIKYAHIMLPMEQFVTMLVLLGFFVNYLVTSINLYIMVTIAVCIGLLNTMDVDNRLVPLHDASWDFAILAKVMMGAAILGLAGRLTSALGVHGFWAVLLGFAVVLLKAIAVSGQHKL